MASTNGYKRKYKRMTASFFMKLIAYNHIRLDSEYCTCAEGINISPSGLSFKYPKVIDKDDHIKVIIHNLSGIKRDEIMANIRIVWAETKDILSKRFGGRFVKISPDDKYKLMKLIRQRAN